MSKLKVKNTIVKVVQIYYLPYFDLFPVLSNYYVVIANIFSYTSLLDKKKIVLLSEMIKLGMIGFVFWTLSFNWFGLSEQNSMIFMVYQLISLMLNINFTFKNSYNLFLNKNYIS